MGNSDEKFGKICSMDDTGSFLKIYFYQSYFKLFSPGLVLHQHACDVITYLLFKSDISGQ
jgi:hypothetical protein